MSVLCPQNWVTGVLVLASVLQVVHASWWYLGVASSYQVISDELLHEPAHQCAKLPFLGPRQKELCKLDVQILDVISRGASMGIEECQHHFSHRRWNCTTYNNTRVFGAVLDIKSRETAYIYAISSAGITYAVTRACAKGELEKCGCDSKVRQRQPGKDFQWGGCSENIRYGSRFARQFLDSDEMATRERGHMNLWNNGAGRKTIKDTMAIKCKCHGVSGDCSVKICWKKMESFRKIGAALKARFMGASIVVWDEERRRLKRSNNAHKKPTKRDLVYIKKSPNFCDYKPESGSLGTRGRECNATGTGLAGCELMCCGRGYHTLVNREEIDCDCKFYWCCRVECKKCVNQVEKHYCN